MSPVCMAMHAFSVLLAACYKIEIIQRIMTQGWRHAIPSR